MSTHFFSFLALRAFGAGNKKWDPEMDLEYRKKRSAKVGLLTSFFSVPIKALKDGKKERGGDTNFGSSKKDGFAGKPNPQNKRGMKWHEGPHLAFKGHLGKCNKLRISLFLV